MGHSQSISEMTQKEETYRNYLKKIQEDLETRSKKYNDEMQKKLNDYYKDNHYDKLDFISGMNADFMQQSEWSMKNVKAIIDAITKAVFGDTKAPDGVTIEKAEEIGKAITAMENMELYIAGKCFEVLSGIVESFGSSTSVSFNSSYKHEPLGNGMHLFATVVCDSYKSQGFFENSEIYEYLYIYEVKYSVDEAKTLANVELTKLYEDQIATFTKKVEDLLDQLSSDKITPEQYESNSEIYNTLIDKSKKKLDELKSAALLPPSAPTTSVRPARA